MSVYFAPVGVDLDSDGWVHLGHCPDDGTSFAFEPDVPAAPLGFVGERQVSFTAHYGPRQYRRICRLFRIPILPPPAVLHRAYRRRWRARRRRR